MPERVSGAAASPVELPPNGASHPGLPSMSAICLCSKMALALSLSTC